MKKLYFQYGLIGDDLNLIENVILQIDERNRIVTIEEISTPIKNSQLVFPAFINAHVHAADIGLRGVKRTSLAKLVGPNGIKHMHLSNLSPKEIEGAILASQQEAIHHGVLGWADFREGGIQGLQDYPVGDHFIPFARPNLSEMDLLPEFAQLGLRDVKQFSEPELFEITQLAKEKDKQIFIHASEDNDLREYWQNTHGETDIIWSIEHLNVDTCIHLTHTNQEDIQVMESKGVNGILCLSSNLFTGCGIPPINELLDAKLQLGIGTDNAMFGKLSIWEELHVLSRETDDYTRLLNMATVEGASILGFNWGITKGNSNFLSVSLPKNIESLDLVKWIVTNGNVERINQIYRGY
jgi:cytosine/adenosine deaminase-related metal-dependent hydrolase